MPPLKALAALVLALLLQEEPAPLKTAWGKIEWKADGALLHSFFTTDPGFRGGVFIASDADHRDGPINGPPGITIGNVGAINASSLTLGGAGSADHE